MGGGQHHRAYVTVGGQRGARTGDGPGHGGGDRVHGLRPVEDQLGDEPVPPHHDELPEPLLGPFLTHDTLLVNAG